MSENINSIMFISSSARNHELTMLYLKQQDLSKMSVPEIAKKYSSTKDEFDKAFKEIRANKVYFA